MAEVSCPCGVAVGAIEGSTRVFKSMPFATAGRWEQPAVAVGVYLPGTYAADNGLDPAATSVEAVMAAHGFTFTFGGDAGRGPWRYHSAAAYKVHCSSDSPYAKYIY